METSDLITKIVGFIVGLGITLMSGNWLWQIVQLLIKGGTVGNLGGIVVAGILLYFFGSLLLLGVIVGIGIMIFSIFGD